MITAMNKNGGSGTGTGTAMTTTKREGLDRTTGAAAKNYGAFAVTNAP
jgi:hypothetical protein